MNEPLQQLERVFSLIEQRLNGATGATVKMEQLLSRVSAKTNDSVMGIARDIAQKLAIIEGTQTSLDALASGPSNVPDYRKSKFTKIDNPKYPTSEVKKLSRLLEGALREAINNAINELSGFGSASLSARAAKNFSGLQSGQLSIDDFLSDFEKGLRDVGQKALEKRSRDPNVALTEGERRGIDFVSKLSKIDNDQLKSLAQSYRESVQKREKTEREYLENIKRAITLKKSPFDVSKEISDWLKKTLKMAESDFTKMSKTQFEAFKKVTEYNQPDVAPKPKPTPKINEFEKFYYEFEASVRKGLSVSQMDPNLQAAVDLAKGASPAEQDRWIRKLSSAIGRENKKISEQVAKKQASITTDAIKTLKQENIVRTPMAALEAQAAISDAHRNISNPNLQGDQEKVRDELVKQRIKREKELNEVFKKQEAVQETIEQKEQKRQIQREARLKKRTALIKENIQGIKDSIKAGEQLNATQLKLVERATEQARVGKFTNKMYKDLASTLNLAKNEIKDIDGVIKIQNKNLTSLQRTISRARNAYLLLMFAIRPVIDFFTKTIQVAIKYERAILAAERVGKKFGATSTQMSVALDTLTKDGLISMTEAAQGLRNMLATGLSIDQATKALLVFKDAAALNRQGMLSQGEALVGASDGFKNLRSIMLDNVGITTNISTLLKREAIARGVQLSQLSEATKYQMLYNAILKEGVIFQGDSAKVANTLGGKVDQLGRSWEKMQANLVAGNLSGFFSAIVKGINAATVAISNFLDSTPELTKAANALRKAGDEEGARKLEFRNDKSSIEELSGSFGGLFTGRKRLNLRAINYDDMFLDDLFPSPIQDLKGFVETGAMKKAAIAENRKIIREVRKDIKAAQANFYEQIEELNKMPMGEDRDQAIGELVENYINSLIGFRDIEKEGFLKLDPQKFNRNEIDKYINLRERDFANEIARIVDAVGEYQRFKDQKTEEAAKAVDKASENKEGIDKFINRIKKATDGQIEDAVERIKEQTKNDRESFVLQMQDKAKQFKWNDKQIKEIADLIDTSFASMEEDEIRKYYQNNAAKGLKGFLSRTSRATETQAERDIKAIETEKQKYLDEIASYNATQKEVIKQEYVELLGLVPGQDEWPAIISAIESNAQDAIAQINEKVLQSEAAKELEKKLKAQSETFAGKLFQSKKSRAEAQIQQLKDGPTPTDAQKQKYGLDKLASELERIDSKVADINSNYQLQQENLLENLKLIEETANIADKEALVAENASQLLALKNENTLELLGVDKERLQIFARIAEIQLEEKDNLTQIKSGLSALSTAVRSYGSESKKRYADDISSIAQIVDGLQRAKNAYNDLEKTDGLSLANANATLQAVLAAAQIAASIADIINQDDDKKEEERRRRRALNRQSEIGSTINRGPNTVNINPSIIVSAEGDVLFAQDSIEVIRQQLINEVQNAYTFNQFNPDGVQYN